MELIVAKKIPRVNSYYILIVIFVILCCFV